MPVTTTSTTIAAGPVALDVVDLDGVRRFYLDALGLQQRSAAEGVVRLGTEERDLVVLHQAPGASPAPRNAGLFHLALLYPGRAELAEALLRLARAGSRLDGASDHLVSEALYLHDPEGNGIELYRDRPRDQWRHEPSGQVEMATIALDLQDLLGAARSDAPPAAIPGETIMGHVHLQVADLAATRAFYVDLLGFDVATDSYPDALFLATGGYHHHVGTNVWRSRGLAAVPGARGLRHATLLLRDEAIREQVLERLRDAGTAIDASEDGAPVVRDPAGIGLRLALADDEAGRPASP
jgi:catechol 2,3-dioxygenase